MWYECPDLKIYSKLVWEIYKVFENDGKFLSKFNEDEEINMWKMSSKVEILNWKKSV
jgi:hypothetical protein